MATKKSKTVLQIETCIDKILNGTLLSIDPSIGSTKSSPGWALFVNGQLAGSGLVKIDKTLPRNKKLYELNRQLKEDFLTPDVVAVEDIPMVQFNRAVPMNANSLGTLQRAVGAISSAWNIDAFIEVHPASWQRWKPEDYVKSDEADAICIGLCVIGLAKEIQDKLVKKYKKDA